MKYMSEPWPIKKRKRQLVREKIIEEKLRRKCVRCGLNPTESTIEEFHFHHRSDNRDFRISKSKGHCWNTVMQEIDKCDLLCEQCHFIVHGRIPRTPPSYCSHFVQISPSISRMYLINLRLHEAD
jgi:hypothetical protein